MEATEDMKKKTKAESKKRKVDIGEVTLPVPVPAAAIPFIRRSASIHGRSSPSQIVSLLKQRFDAANIEKFRSSCFGQYVDIPHMSLQGPLIFSLLRNLKGDPYGEGKMRFDFKGVEAEFGPDEFYSISGLSFGPPVVIPEYSNFVATTFGLNGSTITKCIKERFIELCNETGGGGDDALKLGLCLFLYAVLIGRGTTNHPIHVKYMNLCDDLEAFNSYPWGRLAYEFMVDEFQKSKIVVERQIGNENNVSCDVFGFVLCLQVWAFHVFPDIGQLKPYKRFQTTFTVPRILGCPCSAKTQYDIIEDLLELPMPLKKVEYRFSAEEEFQIAMDRPYNRKIVRTVPRSIPVRTAPSRYPAARRRLQFRLRDEVDDVPFEEAVLQPISPVFSSSDPYLFDLNFVNPCRSSQYRSPSTSPGSASLYSSNAAQSPVPLISKSPDISGDLLVLFGGSAEGLSLCEPGYLSFVSGQGYHATSQTEFGACSLDATFSGGFGDGNTGESFLHRAVYESCAKDVFEMAWFEDWYSQPLSRNLSSPESSYSADTSPCSNDSTLLSFDHGDRASYEIQSMRKNASANVVQQPLIPVAGVQECTPPIQQTVPMEISSPVMYSPMKRYPRQLLEPFLDWYRNAKAEKKGSFRSALQMIDNISLQWIRGLYRPHRMLYDWHCDAILNLLLLKSRVAPNKFREHWSCVEFLFWSKTTYSPFIHGSDMAVKYVLGELPLERPLRWCDASEIYGIAHLPTNHWVAYEINMLDGKIYVFDSLWGADHWEHVASCFRPLSQSIPKLLLLAKERDPTFVVPEYDHVDWPIVSASVDIHRQTGVNDCGILAAKYVESLASDYPLVKVMPQKCSSLRRYYCGQLYNAGKRLEAVDDPLNM